MYGQAAGLAALAAVSPGALLLVTVYLGSATPGRTVSFYLAGALLMTAVMGVVVLVALKSGHLSAPGQRQPRYGLRLGLGVVALAAGIYLLRHGPRPRPAKPKKPKKPGLMSRWAANPRPLTAFASGLAVFAPSVGFIAAVQVIATSRAGVAADAAALAMVVIIDVVLVWLPLGVYAIAPGRTVAALKASNGWISANRHTLAAGALTIIGAILVADGITGLA